MILRRYFLFQWYSGDQNVLLSRAYRSAEIFRQAGIMMFLSCACEVSRCQNRFTMKKSRCRAQRSTWRQSQKPNERRLPVRGQSAPRVTSSVRAVWPFFDWRQTANIVLAPQSLRYIYDVCHPRHYTRRSLCAVEIDTTISPLLWRAESGRFAKLRGTSSLRTDLERFLQTCTNYPTSALNFNDRLFAFSGWQSWNASKIRVERC